jgi:hypothetical protein
MGRPECWRVNCLSNDLLRVGWRRGLGAGVGVTLAGLRVTLG